MPGAISQVFPKTEATSLSVCCVQMLPEAGEIQSGGGEAPLTALSLLTRSLRVSGTAYISVPSGVNFTSFVWVTLQQVKQFSPPWSRQ